MKKQRKTRYIPFLMACLVIGTSGFWSCKDDEDISAYDPSSPVEITKIDPEEGNVGTQCLIYGKNFGKDTSQIEVTINGKTAHIVGSSGDCVYCFIPTRAGSGPVKIKVGTGDQMQEAVSPKDFNYVYTMRVGTLSGYTDKDGKHELKDGRLDEAGYDAPYWMELDKVTGDIFLLEEKKSIRRISIKRDTVETLFKITESIGQPRSLSFSVDYDTLFVSNDQGVDNGISNCIFLRKDDFRKMIPLTYGTSNCGASTHPIDAGVYFFSKWNNGDIFKWDGAYPDSIQSLYQIAGGLNGSIQFAPNGEFAYIVDRDHHNVYKAMYNKKTRELMKAQPFVGGRDQNGFRDAVGTDARFSNPAQGAFDDENNFYLCDQGNYCIRKVEPNGTVTTFAGRPGLWGYGDGDLRKEAQFNRPFGIVYDRETETFYVADKNNWRIRTILKE